MKPLLIFGVIVALVFIAGALISYPLYLGFSLVTEVRFHKLIHYSTVLTGLALGIYYLKATHQLKTIFGLSHNSKGCLKVFFTGFTAGILILLAVEISLYGLGMRQSDPDLYNGVSAFLLAVIKATIAGLAVGLLEETLYRGAIFTGLAGYTGRLTALITTSAFYAAVHYIDFSAIPAGNGIVWSTGFTTLINAFNQFSDPGIYDSFLTLFILGLLLGLIRWRSGNIVPCISVHAGIVAINKIFSYATDYQTGSPYSFLVNRYDHLTGYLASFWLCIAILVYYYKTLKTTYKTED